MMHLTRSSLQNTNLGINFSTGSLGNGLAHALIGTVWSKAKENVICILGDGECEE